MHVTLLRKVMASTVAMASALGSAPALADPPGAGTGMALERPVNPDWPPIPLDEDLYADNPVPAYHSSNSDPQIEGFIQAFYECLSSCGADEQLPYLRFPGKIILPTTTIRTSAQYRAEADRRQHDDEDLDYFVNTFKATGDSDAPLVHVTVLSSGTHVANGARFRFLTDEQLRLNWDEAADSYKIVQYQINTMAPA